MLQRSKNKSVDELEPFLTTAVHFNLTRTVVLIQQSRCHGRQNDARFLTGNIIRVSTYMRENAAMQQFVNYQ
jgi:hypothetical protein